MQRLYLYIHKSLPTAWKGSRLVSFARSPGEIGEKEIEKQKASLAAKLINVDVQASGIVAVELCRAFYILRA